ncbi:MAG: pirin family protein [Nannocystaceae bacterium]
MTEQQDLVVRRVKRVVQGRSVSDGAGVRIRRLIGVPELDALDPFLMFDEFRSDDADDYIAGFPDHPHRGFETVTYMFAGRLEHQDSVGNRGDLGPGWVQWMTAGRGIIHSEMPRQERGLMWGVQIWVNLPSHLKMTPPRYQDVAPSEIPEVATDGARVKVLAGSFGGVEGPVGGIATAPLLVDIALEAGARCEVPVPRGHTCLTFAVEGALMPSPGHAPVDRGALVVFEDGDKVCVESPVGASARCVLMAGAPLREPIARHGPFVMNTQRELVQAFEDYRSGRFTSEG